MAQLAAALAVGATNQGLQTGGNFNQRERFTQIVIGAEAQPFNPLAERIAGREDQYRLVAALITPFAQDIQPVDAGQRQVEDRRVIGRRIERGFALFAAGKPVDAEAHFCQPDFNAIADELVVFHQ